MWQEFPFKDYGSDSGHKKFVIKTKTRQVFKPGGLEELMVLKSMSFVPLQVEKLLLEEISQPQKPSRFEKNSKV